MRIAHALNTCEVMPAKALEALRGSNAIMLGAAGATECGDLLAKMLGQAD